MPATKEEIITTLADAKARFEKIIKEEEKSKKNIIANASMYSGSILDYLEAKVEQINNTIDKINELKAEFAKQEPVGLKEGEQQEESPTITEIAGLRNELNKIVEDILEHMHTYHVVLWEYTVRITSKYYHLLTILSDIANLPEIQNKLDRREKTKHNLRLKKLKEEYALFEHNEEKAEFDSIDWISFIQETVQPKLGETALIGFEKSYEAFTRIVTAFVNDHRENLELVAGLIEKQTTLRFKQILQLADQLIEKAAA
ncbi:hypothetical protein KY338_06185 [Candidatus Woesearchaeota archaeon]|nr:hypothetical protein [Candidatus Woesearchaeota archaeon]MBW3005403.1 hypothetical protein [Candidatus Woesearchaeota archaeon]